MEEHETPRDPQGLAVELPPLRRQHSVDHVGGENQIEVLIGEIQALQRIAHGYSDCMVIKPRVTEEPPRRGDHPGRGIHCPDLMSHLRQHGDIGPGAATDIQDPGFPGQIQTVLKSFEASPKGQSLRMEQEAVNPGYPVENPDAGISREASVRVAGHRSPILRRRNEAGKAGAQRISRTGVIPPFRPHADRAAKRRGAFGAASRVIDKREYSHYNISQRREPLAFRFSPVLAHAERSKRPLTVESMRRNLSAARAEWHSRCVACGSRNGQGLRLEFTVGEAGYTETSFGCDAVFEGFPGFLHGGIIATLLDAAMTNCLFAHGFVGLTGELKVRYYHPVSIDKVARAYAWLERSVHRLHYMRSELEQNGVIKAAASSRFLEMDPAIGKDDSGGAPAASGGPQK